LKGFLKKEKKDIGCGFTSTRWGRRLGKTRPDRPHPSRQDRNKEGKRGNEKGGEIKVRFDQRKKKFVVPTAFPRGETI